MDSATFLPQNLKMLDGFLECPAVEGGGACQGVPSNIFCDFGAQRAENDDSSTFRLQNFRTLDGFLKCSAEQGGGREGGPGKAGAFVRSFVRSWGYHPTFFGIGGLGGRKMWTVPRVGPKI